MSPPRCAYPRPSKYPFGGHPQSGQAHLGVREIGFRIAIDDLGAGYAGLSSFALLEPDVVKIDMTLVRDVEKAPTQAKLIQPVCAVCRDLYLLAGPGPAFPAFAWGS